MKTKQNFNSNPMKNIFLLLLLFAGIAEAQNVAIPDAGFKSILINCTSPIIDTNADDQIQVSEALAITSLYLIGYAATPLTIVDMTGVEAFTNLQTIHFTDFSSVESMNISTLTQIQSIDFNNIPLSSLQLPSPNNITVFTYSMAFGSYMPDASTLQNVQELYISQSYFTTMDFSGFSNLKSLTIFNNSSLSTINISGLTNLETLNIQNNTNLIMALNVSDLVNLKTFNATSNVFTSIDFSGLTHLENIDCNGNYLLTSLNLTGLTNLITLICYDNDLTTLDASDLENVTSIDCRVNQLTTIFAKNGQQEAIDLAGNPNLSFVCADSNQLATIQGSLTTLGLNNVVLNSYCSFVPGGNYNTIIGNIRYDADTNGCDSNDVVFPNIRINLDDTINQGAAYTNLSGNFEFYTQEGTFEINPSLENPTWFNFSPVTATIPFADNNNNTTIQDFCIAPIGFHPDVEVVISPVFFARPGFDATYQITYRNKGNQTISGIVNLIFDDSRTDFVSANPSVDNLAVNSLSWNYSNLLPFESRIITVVLNVNSPTETPAVNNGDILNFEASISPVVSDENPLDNTFLYNQTVVGSYDPNDITCLEGAVVPPSEIGNYLHYVINFENTGTFPAENVVVKTEIDAAKFDIGSLQLMNSNFPVDARITGNKVEFIFENIQLPIGGHGHILLKVRTQNSLVTGDAVANRGDIYFDYNFPIDTGLANTVFQTLSNSVFEIDNSVLVYPNPAAMQVNIKSDSVIQTIQMFDVQGRILQTKISNEKQTTFDLTRNEKGIYFFKIITDRGIKIEKVIKE